MAVAISSLMSQLTIQSARSLQGEITLPGDKSISHRAILFGAISEGITRVSNCLKAEDVDSTRKAIQALGVSVEVRGDERVVHGKGIAALKSPSAPIDCGNSGTTTRLLLGLLSGLPIAATLTGDASLSKRPMRRVTEPLEKMGAKFHGPNGPDRLPLTVQGGSLKGITYTLPIPSAQLKSAILLAGLSAQGPTTVIEPVESRDHTERMLSYFGTRVKRNGLSITIEPGAQLKGRQVSVPGDISSAAFFLVGAAIVPGSSIVARRIGLNPTRTGLIDLLKRMGANIWITSVSGEDWEPTGDVTMKSSRLHGENILDHEIPRLIDELPILMVAATQAEGKTVIQGAGELRVKETDRIHSMVTGLSAMGAKIYAEGDSVVIDGPTSLRGAQLQSFGDHRTAMALAIAGLVADGPTEIEGAEWIGISFPEFPQLLRSLIRA